MDYFCKLVDGKQSQGPVMVETERDNEIEMQQINE